MDKEEVNLRVYVVVGIYEGIINDIEAFSTPERADEYEEALCKRYGIPYDQKERKKYYEERLPIEHEVYQYILEVDKWLPATQ